MDKEILFRLNAGEKFGMGHLSRNIALADVFSKNNFECRFIIQTDDKNKVLSFLKSRGKTNIQTIFINEETNADEDIRKIIEHYYNGKSFLILDHYKHDFYYQEELRKVGILWAQFDYKKEEQIIADLVINPNVGVNDFDYVGLISNETKLCVGEKFAIISEVFKKINVQPQVNRILIAMGGGSYPPNIDNMITNLVLDQNYKFDLITTQNVFKNKLKGFDNVEVHKNPKNIAAIYARNHVACVAGGVTTYELAYLDIPMIIVPYSDNQQENARKWQELNHAIRFSSPEKFRKNLKARGLQVILSELYNHYKKRKKLIDGKGGQRIVETIKNQFNG